MYTVQFYERHKIALENLRFYFFCSPELSRNSKDTYTRPSAEISRRWIDHVATLTTDAQSMLGYGVAVTTTGAFLPTEIKFALNFKNLSAKLPNNGILRVNFSLKVHHY